MSTVSQQPQDKKVKIAELRKLHEPVFEALGCEDGLYIPKMAYRPLGKDELHVSFWPSEFQRAQDIFTEFVSRDYDSEDPTRTLYRWNFNPHWEEEYDKSEPSSTGAFRYLVPVSELIKVQVPKAESKELDKKKFEDLMDPDADSPLDQMTMRDIAAIFLKNPCSKKEWLNEIIIKDNNKKSK